MTTLLIKAVQARLPDQKEYSTQEQIGNVIEAIAAIVLENAKAGETTHFGTLGTFKPVSRKAGRVEKGIDGKPHDYPAYEGVVFDDSKATRDELTAAKAVTTQDDGV